MKESKMWMAMAFAFVLLAVGFVSELMAADPKYCKNYKTGQIIVVSAGMPCPFPTVEL